MSADIPIDVLQDVQRRMANFAGGSFENQQSVFLTAVNFDYLPALEMCQNMWPPSVFLEHAKQMFDNVVVSGSLSVFNILLPIVDATTKSNALHYAIQTGNEECYDALQEYIQHANQWCELILSAAFAENTAMAQKLLSHPLAEHRHTKEVQKALNESLIQACQHDYDEACDILASLVSPIDCQHCFNDAIAYNCLHAIPVLARYVDLQEWGKTVNTSNTNVDNDGFKLAIELWRAEHTRQCQEQLQSIVPQGVRAPLKKM